jgi:excisionase family DNA binding protein
LAHYLQISGSPTTPETGVILLKRESFALRAEVSEDDVAQSCDPVQQVSGVVPAVTDCVSNDADSSVGGKTVDANSHVTTGEILSSVGARSAPSDLFDLLESKPVWSIEELAEVLKVSRKTLYKQAKRGNFPSFRIGSCVRVYGRGLADHVRGKMKK